MPPSIHGKGRPVKLTLARLLAITLLALVVLSLSPAAWPRYQAVYAEPVAYVIDPVHSEISFKVRHFVTKVPGRFNKFEGTVYYDEVKPAASSAVVSIEASSIDTKNERRDGHLKSADFFDVEKFPNLNFLSKRISFEGDKFTLLGDLTMHGVTKPITLTGEMTGIMPISPTDKKLGFSATTKINRKEYGILWNKTLDQGNTMLGDDVDVTIEVEATYRKSAPEEAAKGGQ